MKAVMHRKHRHQQHLVSRLKFAQLRSADNDWSRTLNQNNSPENIRRQTRQTD